jgi:hypothetical protein
MPDAYDVCGDAPGGGSTGSQPTASRYQRGARVCTRPDASKTGLRRSAPSAPTSQQIIWWSWHSSRLAQVRKQNGHMKTRWVVLISPPSTSLAVGKANQAKHVWQKPDIIVRIILRETNRRNTNHQFPQILFRPRMTAVECVNSTGTVL